MISPEESWLLWALMLSGVASCIYLEQSFKWGSKISGPVLALLGGMLLSNSKLMPFSAPAYDIVDDYFVPVAIPLLLFRANVLRIMRGTGRLFLAFHIATVGTIIGAFIASFCFRNSFPRVPEVAGIMAGSYIGGGVNFVAVKNSYQVSSELTNPLLVADNFIMAGLFAVLFMISTSRFFLSRYPHPHIGGSADSGSSNLSAQYWDRKEIALLDIAKAVAIAFGIAAASVMATRYLKGKIDSKLLLSFIGNPYLLITLTTVAITTIFHRSIEKIHGAEEIGGYLLYVFFFVIGLRADLWQVVLNVPVLFSFCTIMAVSNLTFTLLIGRCFRIDLEDLLLAVNATIGGPPTAAAMAISKGWSALVLPGLLAGLWGYVIGTFLGIAVVEVLQRVL